jgi:hypothetical protein
LQRFSSKTAFGTLSEPQRTTVWETLFNPLKPKLA